MARFLGNNLRRHIQVYVLGVSQHLSKILHLENTASNQSLRDRKERRGLMAAGFPEDEPSFVALRFCVESCTL